jgi:NAD dependent epimerase/dehydratase
MKKILITGACGFIGSHLTEMMIKKGYNVIAFDRYNSNNDYGWLNKSKYKKHIEFELGDIRDFDSVYKVMKKAKTVFHLAALIGIPYSYISPLAYIKTNVEGTYNVLESSKILNFENVVNISTSETYGSAMYTPMDEEHRLFGQSPYAASKISADQVSLSYYNSFNTPIKLVRPFNVYGPRQSTRAIIPTIICQLLRNSSKICLGNLNTSRDYTYVSDACEAFFEIYKSKKLIGEVINVGTNTNFTIKEIVNIITSEMNLSPKIITDKKRIRPVKSEVQKLQCDNNKLKNITQWVQKNTFKKGMTKTIKWFLKNKKFFDTRSYHV